MKIESSLNEYNYNLANHGMANVTTDGVRHHHVTSDKWAIPAQNARLNTASSHVRNQQRPDPEDEGITIQVLQNTTSPRYGSPPSRLSPVDLPTIRPRSRSVSSEPLIIKTDAQGKPRVISAGKSSTAKSELKFPKIVEKKNLVQSSTVNGSERIKRATHVAKQKGVANDPLDFFRRALSGEKQPFLKSNIPGQRARTLVPGGDASRLSPSPRKPAVRSPRPSDKPASPPSRNSTSPTCVENPTSMEPAEVRLNPIKSIFNCDRAQSNIDNPQVLNCTSIKDRIPSPPSDNHKSTTNSNNVQDNRLTDNCHDNKVDKEKSKPKTRNAVVNIMVEESDSGGTQVVQTVTTYFQTSDDKIREFFGGEEIDFSSCTQPFRQRAQTYTFGTKFKELKERLGNADIVITELD